MKISIFKFLTNLLYINHIQKIYKTSYHEILIIKDFQFINIFTCKSIIEKQFLIFVEQIALFKNYFISELYNHNEYYKRLDCIYSDIVQQIEFGEFKGIFNTLKREIKKEFNVFCILGYESCEFLCRKCGTNILKNQSFIKDEFDFIIIKCKKSNIITKIMTDQIFNTLFTAIFIDE